MLLAAWVTTLWGVLCMGAETVYPKAKWAERTPAEVGMDAARLSEFGKYVGGRGCVVRHGYMVYTWGDAGKRGDVASAAKPWYSHFLLKAIEDGKIPSVDQEVAEWEPRLGKINPDLGHKDRLITWRHMANLGHAVPEGLRRSLSNR